MFFPVDQFIDGKVKYQAGKIYAIAETSVHRWMKRGCVVVTEEVAATLKEQEIEITISQPVFGAEKIQAPPADIPAPPVAADVKGGDQKTDTGVEGGEDAGKTPEATDKKKSGTNKKNQ